MRSLWLIGILVAPACGSSGGGADASGEVPDAGVTGPDAAPDTFCDPLAPRAEAPEVFVGPGGIEPAVLPIMDAAAETLDVMMYQFTVASFTDALIAAHERGVTVRVLLDATQGVNAQQRGRLETAGVEVRDAPVAFEHNHAKVVIADGEVAAVMSANMNGFSVSSERNYGVIDRDPYDVADLQAIFDADWDDGGSTPQALTCTRLIVSPVNSRPRILSFINAAETSIAVAAMYISDSAVRNALVARASAGVDVRVLLADPAWIDSNTQTAEELAAEGIPVRFLTTWELHAKLILADGVALVGSHNFSYTSLEDNREIGLLVEGTGIDDIAAQFETDWNDGVAP